MSVVKWNPWREMEAMSNEMNRLFSWVSGQEGFRGDSKPGGQWILPVDVTEKQDALTFKAALPGVSPEDVRVEVNDQVLTITAERRHEDKIEEGGYQWIEQQYGTFSRSLTLPRYADTTKIEARYNNGMLELTVPKQETAKPRRIELQTGSHSTQAIEAGASAQPGKQPAEQSS
jgi:HSP20 family protein